MQMEAACLNYAPQTTTKGQAVPGRLVSGGSRGRTLCSANLEEDLCSSPLRKPPAGEDVGGLLTGPEEAQRQQGVPAIRLAIQLVDLGLQPQPARR